MRSYSPVSAVSVSQCLSVAGIERCDMAFSSEVLTAHYVGYNLQQQYCKNIIIIIIIFCSKHDTSEKDIKAY